MVIREKARSILQGKIKTLNFNQIRLTEMSL